MYSIWLFKWEGELLGSECLGGAEQTPKLRRVKPEQVGLWVGRVLGNGQLFPIYVFAEALVNQTPSTISRRISMRALPL